MAAGEWDNFAIFDGDCTLTKDIFQRFPPLDNPEKSIEEGAKRFCKWVDDLSQNTAANGIPATRVTVVKGLLDKFFRLSKTGSAENPTLHPEFVDVAIRDLDGEADPMPVPFGDNDSVVLPINDGPVALGYIFSIARQPNDQPPATGRTWENFAVPLLALYSRWTYLAYIKTSNHKTPPKWKNSIPMNVPWMTCAMHFKSTQTGNFHLLLSATCAPRRNDCQRGASNERKTQLMNLWRSREVLRNPLTTSSLHKSWPPANGPPLGPVLAESVADCVLKFLRGKNLKARSPVPSLQTNYPVDYNVDSDWITVDLAAAEIGRTKCLEALMTGWNDQGGVPEPIVPMPQGEIFETKKVSAFDTDPKQPLRDIVTIRWRDPYDRNSDEIVAAFKAAFRAYFAPRMFYATADGRPDLDRGEMSRQIAVYSGTCELLADAVWLQSSLKVLNMLDRVHYWVEISDVDLKFAGSRVPRYGRCAETYAVSGLLREFCPDRRYEGNHRSEIRGFAFEARRFNSGIADAHGSRMLAEKFDRAVLNDIQGLRETRGELYRLPCDNCRILLPWFEIPIGDTAYDRDLMTLYNGKVV